MDQEQLEILKRYCNPIPGNRLDQIANDYGTNTKDIKDRVRLGLKFLIEYYETKELNNANNASTRDVG